MGSRADLRSAAGNDGYVLWNQQRVLGETPILDESEEEQCFETMTVKATSM
jgi:hypothetical protein